MGAFAGPGFGPGINRPVATPATDIGGLYWRPKQKLTTVVEFQVTANFGVESYVNLPLTISYLEPGETLVEMVGRQYEVGTIQISAVWSIDKSYKARRPKNRRHTRNTE